MKAYISMFSIVCIILAGCSSNHLTRDKAFQIIKAEKLYHKAYGYYLFCNDPGHARMVLESKLEDMGFLTVDRTQKLKDVGNPLIYFSSKAAPYFLPVPEEDKRSPIQRVKLADEVFNEVTGIKTSSNRKSAVVLYTTNYVHITPFAVLVKSDLHKPRNNKIYLSLYDDGWRIEKKTGIESLELEK